MSDRLSVRNRAGLATTPARETALSCVEAGIQAADPERAVRAALDVGDGRLRVDDGPTYDLGAFDRVVVVGGGKAATGMASGVVTVLTEQVTDGVVVTDAAGMETDGVCAAAPANVDVVAGSHPVPDERGVDGARRVLGAVADADARTLVIVVLSGGASALLPAPVDGLTLADLRAVTEGLLDAGAAIDEVNTVRKHCSASKGGRLARTARPATVLTLAVSDVVGGDPAVIGSGPTVPDPTTYADARAVVDRYDVDVPAVFEYLDAGVDEEETPTAGDPAFDRTAYRVVADGPTAVDAARRVAEDRGYETLVLSTRVRGEAAPAGETHVAVAEECLRSGEPVTPPAVVLSGGETTVTVDGGGKGGPNGSFALAAAIALADGPPLQEVGGRPCGRVAVAAVDTDGRDGPPQRASPPAGALVDGHTVENTDRARQALSRDDAHSHLARRGDLVVTGPTGTNVNDLRVVVVETGRVPG